VSANTTAEKDRASIDATIVDEAETVLINLMRLLSEDADQKEIERIFRGDPGLTYKRLLLVNSVG
jgi:c-di-GMP-related signal transduction protein